MASEDDDIKPKKASRAQTSMLVWVLMAMLIAGLGGFGVTNFGRSVTAVGSVGTQEIEVNAYARALRAQINTLSRQFGTQLTLQQAQMFGIDQQVLQSLIADAALDNEATRLGLSVGDATVAQQIARDKSFQDVTGKFSADTYRQLLEQARMTVKEYESGLRLNAARTILQSAVVSGTKAPAAMTDTLFAYAGETRSFSLLHMTEATLPTPLPVPSDADLQAYYTAHIDTFTRPEAKRLTYVTLLPADLASGVTVTDDEVKALYDERASTYLVPEKRLVERLVYPSDAEAAAAKARLDAGDSFETLVTARGLTLTDIDLGDVSKSELGKAGDAVFALTEPGIVGPVPTDLGPAILRMNAILPAQETKLADVQDALRTELQTKAAAAEVAKRQPDIEDALAGGAALEDLAKNNGMTLGTTDFVEGAADNDPVATDAAFAAAAAKVAEGDYPEVIQLANGGIAALRMDSTQPPTAVPFDKIRDKVTAAQHAEELAKALKSQAEAALAAVTAGAQLTSQGAVNAVVDTTRNATPDGTTPAVLAQAFKMAVGDTALIDTPDFTGLIQLTGVTPVDPASDTSKAAYEQLATQAEQSMAQDAYDLFTTAMTTQGGLTIDQTVVNSVLSQMN